MSDDLAAAVLSTLGIGVLVPMLLISATLARIWLRTRFRKGRATLPVEPEEG